MQAARERAPAQKVVCVRLVLHEVRDRKRDLVVDLVELRVELRKDADLGDKEVGIRNTCLVQIARQHCAVLDGKAVQRRAAREQSTNLRLDAGFELDQHAVGKAGLEFERAHV